MSQSIGLIDGALRPLSGKPNCVSSQTDQNEKLVEPWPFKANLNTSVNAVLKTLKNFGNIRVETQESHYIHAVAVTPLMRFKDDVEFLFDEANGQIHFRSASRVGRSDLGTNRKRYNALRQIYSSL